ncbi:MAG: GNAT family N-acetyltransferase [Rhodospirillaceae bacterium]|nr:GNAT family N-acetyltransferase [Rhodospirillaceae bacterium]
MSDAAFTIRKARLSEADALSELAVRSKAHWGYDAAFMARCREALRVDTAAMRLFPYYVVERDGALLGFYGLEPEADQIGLAFFFVAPEAIGSGLGRALLDHAKETARTEGYDELIAIADPNAASFYEKMGGRPAGATPSEVDPARPLPVLRFPLV